ncbi:hypothetical protein N0V90_003306 [Kalmusia sp. IMI 367209]|nr:hypothetical protein N0V90_003306 [Kalmusia sp. IMI 367209]
MATKNCMLGAFAVALAGVARAGPQRVGIGIIPVFPITNATTPAPRPTDTGSTCEASCDVRYPELFGVSWVPEAEIVFTETVTVGTVSIITATIGENTMIRTETVYDDTVPRWYTLYHVSTNEAGTKIVEADITLSDGPTLTTFAYPTPWVDYPSQYHWEGVLPTHDEKYNPTCATATEELAFGEVTLHPLYPQPTNVFADKKDPEGANYMPLYIALQDLPDKKWFDNAFPSESAFASCESVRGKPAPTDISTAKFVFDTATFITSMEKPGVVHQESTVTWWEDVTTTEEPPDLIGSSIPNARSSTPISTPLITSLARPSTSIPIPDIPRIESTVPLPQQTQRPSRPSVPIVHIPDTSQVVQPAPTNGHGAGQPVPTPNNGNGVGQTTPGDKGAQPALTPAPTLTTPVFTFVPTFVDGQPTAVPVFILPDSSQTATIGQTVTVNGQTTVLTAPTAIFAIVPTKINDVATSTPAFIISGTSTASIGQTVTLDGQPTVLAAPAPYATVVATTIYGIETSITAYIISGSITAFAGQTVTIGGKVTVLPTADALFTTVTTMINGMSTVIPVYIISGSITATIGQTVTIDGTTTVLPTPTNADASATPGNVIFEGQPQATESARGAGTSDLNMPHGVILVCMGAFFLLWL